MRTMLLAGCAALVLAAPAHAQVGGLCTTATGPCASQPDQLLQLARQLQQLATEIQTAQATASTVVNLVQNTVNLSHTRFQNANQVIAAISGTLSQADLLAHQSSTFIASLQAPYYPLPANGMQQVITEQNSTGAAIQSLGRVIDTVNPGIGGIATTLGDLVNEAMTTIGRQQTQQDQAQIAAQHAQQQQQLQAAQMAAVQAQHATMLADHDRQAMQAAWNDQMATRYTPANLDSAPSY